MPVQVAENEKDKVRGELVRVLVGDQKEAFNVHKHLIRASSPFFDKAMSGSWEESAQRTIQLPDDQPPIFATYVHWLYYGTLPVYANERLDAEWLNILKAYTFGDKVLDTRFQNTAISALTEICTTPVDGITWYPGISAIQYVYNNMSDLSLVLKLWVDIYVLGAGDVWLQQLEKQGSIPKPSLFDLASKLLGQQNRPKPIFRAADYYS